MATLKAILAWLRAYWYVPLFVLAVILGWILFRGRKGTPIQQTLLELEAIRTGQKIREMTVLHGAETAKRAARATYQLRKETLDEAQRAQAEALLDDPVALSKFLVRAGGSR